MLWNNHTYQVRQRLLVGVTLAYIILSLIILLPVTSFLTQASLFAGSITVIYSILFILLFAQQYLF